MFRNQDKKQKKKMHKQDLIKVLKKMVHPFQLSASHVDAIFAVMGTPNDDMLVYDRFINAYFDYANDKVIKEFDQMRGIIN